MRLPRYLWLVYAIVMLVVSVYLRRTNVQITDQSSSMAYAFLTSIVVVIPGHFLWWLSLTEEEKEEEQFASWAMH